MVLVLIAGAGCGGGDDGTTDTQSSTATTKTQPAVKTVTSMDATVSVPSPAPEPAPMPTPDTPETPSGPFYVSERQVDPEVVMPGGTTTFSAWVNGDASSVTITVYNLESGALAMTVPLSFDYHASGDLDKWSGTINAPATTGVYRYYARAVSTNGVTADMPGVSGWTFCVGNPSTDCI